MSIRTLVPCILLLGAITSACSGDPEQLKAEYLASGDSYAAKNDYATAIIEYKKAVSQDERFGEARLKLGLAYRATGDMRNAYQELIRAADLMPQNVEALLAAASVRLVGEEFEEARGLALKALERDPKNVEALILMGNALAGLKDLDGAITHIEEALGEDPRMVLAYGNVGLYQVAQGNNAAAESTFKRAVSADPTSVPAHLNLGNFYIAARRRNEAEQAFKKAVEIDPQSPVAARALATFYLESGRRPEAEPLLKTAATNTQGKLVLADYYTVDGKNTQAAEVLRNLAEEAEGYVPATIRLAAIDFQQGKKPEAYARLEEVLERHKGNVPALETKARFLMREQRFEEALAVADAALKDNPDALGSRYIRAASLESLKLSGAALAAFQDLHQRAPTSLPVQLRLTNLYLVEGNANAALELVGAAVKAHPQSGYAHFLRGRALLQLGDLAGAERELLAVSKAVPNSVEAKTWEGLLFEAKNDLARARAAFERARELEPASPLGVAGLISADLKEKKHDSARARIDAAVAANPKNTSLLLLAGNTYAAIGDAAAAERSFERVLEIDAANMEAFSKLGVMYHAQGRLDEAKAKYQDFARRHDKPVAATTFLGMIAELQKNTKEARSMYERALEMEPKAAVAANNLAWIYAETGENLDIALQLAQAAKAQLPNVAQVNDTLGWIYHKKGMTSLAVSFLEEATKQGPPNAGIQYRLGLAYLKNGDPGRARAAFEQALNVNPRFEHAADAKRELQNLPL